MFNWLFEGRISVYILLLALALVLLAIWWRARQRQLLIAAGVVVLLIGLYWLLTFVLTEAKTDRVEITRRLQDMANPAFRDQPGAIERNLSDHFPLPPGQDKKSFAQIVQIRGKNVIVTLSEIDFPTPPSRAEGTTKVNFHVEADGRQAHIETVWDWNAEHGWRLRELHIFPAVGGEYKPF